MTTTTSPAAIDYTSRDYASLRTSMLAHAQSVAPEWAGARGQGDPNDLGVVLIEALAFQGDILSYYTDRVANEAFLSTATRRESVLAHAESLGYTPRSATSATVDLSVAVTTTEDVVVPAGFQVSTNPEEGYEAIVFETLSDTVFPGGADGAAVTTTLTINAAEGVLVEDEIVGTSCGDLDSEFTLNSTPVIASSVVIRIVERPDDPGQVWFPVNNLLDVTGTDNAYSFSVGEGDSFTMRFGDDVNGRVPPRGAVIHARYRLGGGTDGNVEDGTLTEVVNPNDIFFPGTTEGGETILDGGAGGGTAADNPPVIVVTNPQPAAGGTDSESVDSIRANTPKALRARERAVSLADYEALALTIPTVAIAKAKAVGQVYTNVTVYVSPAGGAQPSQEMLNAVVDYFGPRKMIGSTVVAATPQYVPVDLSVDVIVDSRYSQVLVRQLVTRAMADLLDFENVQFGGRVALSDIYTAAQGVEGVRNVLVLNLARAGQTGVTDVVLRDNELPVQGTFVLKATGGVVNSAGATMTGGSGTPSPSSIPVIDLLRNDPNSTHVELHWTPGANTTGWDILVSYLNAGGVVVTSTTAGPFATPIAVLDMPLIGGGRATQISFTTRAYNSNIGPAVSPTATTAYTNN